MPSITRQVLLTIMSFAALALVLLLTVSAEAKEFNLKVPGSATPAASKGADIKQRQIVVESNAGSAPAAKQVADATPKAKLPEAKPQTDADDEDDAQAADAPAVPQASAATGDDDDGNDDTAEAATPAPIPLTRHGGSRYGHGLRLPPRL